VNLPFSLSFSLKTLLAMLRLPSQTPTTEWNSNWKEIQPALRKVRRSMASLRTSSLKVMRVSQLDSDILDMELVDILKEQLWSAISLFKVTCNDTA
jgi:peroxin-2